MRARWSGTLGLAAGAVTALACGALDPFRCVGDAQCQRGDRSGTCMTVGYCAYPDRECPSGQRFSPDAAPAIAGECTEPMLPDPDDSGSSGEPIALDTSESGEVESSDGSSSGGPLPVCGDGVVQDAEMCDDGNATRADGCNPDCVVSGTQLSWFQSGRPEADVAWDVLSWDGDIVTVGAALMPGEDLDLYAARWDAAGNLAWEQTFSGSAHGNDRFCAATRTPSGRLLAAGYVVPNANNTTPRPQFWIGELDPDTGLSLWDDRDGDPPPSSDQVWDILALDESTIVVTGRVGTVAAADFVVRSYDIAAAELAMQWSVAFSGAAKTSDWGFALTLDADGRIVAGGATHAGTVDVDRWLEVFMPDGTTPAVPCRDDGTGADVRVPDGVDQIRGLALTPDGRIAAVGVATKSETDAKDAWVALYDLDRCVPVWQRTVFGREGLDDEGRAVAVDDDGTIVTVGYVRDGNTDDIWVEKWSAEGDSLWRHVINGRADGTDAAMSVAIDDTHEIVVGGYVGEVDGSDTWVGRFAP